MFKQYWNKMFKPVEKHNLDFRRLPHNFVKELDNIEIETDSERKEKLIAILINKSEMLFRKINKNNDIHVQKRAQEIQNLITYLRYKRKH